MLPYLSFIGRIFKNVYGLFSKVTLVVIVFFAVISLFMHFINRDKTQSTYDPVKKNRAEIYKLINDPKLKATDKGKLSIAIYRGVNCAVVGEACTDNPEDADANFKNSLGGKLATLLTLPYLNPPASGVYWAYASLEQSGFVPKSYAAEGIGFAALRPFMNLWKIFRDVCYLILVVILIAIGFMIMFRMKLNPQTVITVENALPRIAVSLLLITFSFPLAGLMVDLMYVLILLAVSILYSNNNAMSPSTMSNFYINAGYPKIISGLFPGGIAGIWKLGNSLLNIIPLEFSMILRTIMSSVIAFLFGNWLHSIADKQLSDVLKTSIPGLEQVVALLKVSISTTAAVLLVIFAFFITFALLPSLIMFILVLLTVILMIFRIFFLLFSAYLKVFLLVTLSPFFMLFEALPGKKSFSYWFKTLLMELLTFPIVIILFILSESIIRISASPGTLWRPPLLSDVDPSALNMMLGMGIVLMIPEIVKVIKQMAGVKDMPLGLGIGTFVGGVGVGLEGFNKTTGMATSLAYMPGIGTLIRGKPGQESTLWKTAKNLLPPTQAKLTGDYMAEKMDEIQKRNKT